MIGEGEKAGTLSAQQRAQALKQLRTEKKRLKEKRARAVANARRASKAAAAPYERRIGPEAVAEAEAAGEALITGVAGEEITQKPGESPAAAILRRKREREGK